MLENTRRGAMLVMHLIVDVRDAMGANTVNTMAEAVAPLVEAITGGSVRLRILSNLADLRLARARVRLTAKTLATAERSGEEIIEGVLDAYTFAAVDPYRAATHNKGIMNGIDAVVLATGNDFRAVEAGIHAYASKSGQYSSLSHVKIENGIFTFWLDVPLALGTVGGLTSLHPLVKFSMELLQKPSAEELMQIVAAAGLAQNFAALRSLTTTGIQQGHMKMHLMNILNQHQATKEEKQKVLEYFKDTTVSHSLVIDYLEKIRS